MGLGNSGNFFLVPIIRKLKLLDLIEVNMSYRERLINLLVYIMTSEIVQFSSHAFRNGVIDLSITLKQTQNWNQNSQIFLLIYYCLFSPKNPLQINVSFVFLISFYELELCFKKSYFFLTTWLSLSGNAYKRMEKVLN